ncbi:MAG: hypothetical protein ACXU82_00040 [Caulobacteraceae bacterium]
MDIDLKSTHYTEAMPLAPLTINPLTVTPIAVHLKELNQVAPLSVDSLRIDRVSHVDPLTIEELNVTGLPTVNLAMSQLPALDINVRKVPPVAIAIHQQFEMCSDYGITAKVLGLPLMRLALAGRTTITPKDCARREQSKSHEKSFTEVAALGNPAIPSRAAPTTICVETGGCRPAQQPRRRPAVQSGAPRFGFSLQASAAPADNAVNGG